MDHKLQPQRAGAWLGTNAAQNGLGTGTERESLKREMPG